MSGKDLLYVLTFSHGPTIKDKHDKMFGDKSNWQYKDRFERNWKKLQLKAEYPLSVHKDFIKAFERAFALCYSPGGKPSLMQGGAWSATNLQ